MRSTSRTITTPTMTSATKWLAVATTAKAIAAGMSTAKPRTSQWRDALKAITPTSRFQPAWKLGIAAYSLTNERGSSCR